ncbi:hypothetical protein BV898_16304 [Hypsibius exemplaris]|uniref:Uncharacterized protein n=1 Tax=Hypsibius exemplaris TaxID=2072580 RepID=A0A9X6ND59_HYPEX|nr:hypothetical protein BV898_16304 [Hypsibius exemplaris]
MSKSFILFKNSCICRRFNRVRSFTGILDNKFHSVVQDQTWRKEEALFLQELRSRTRKTHGEPCSMTDLPQSRQEAPPVVDCHASYTAESEHDFRDDSIEFAQESREDGPSINAPVLCLPSPEERATQFHHQRKALAEHYMKEAMTSPLCTKPMTSRPCTEAMTSPLCTELMTSRCCREAMTSHCCREAMTSRLCTVNHVSEWSEGTAPTLFNVQLAKRDSLVVQFRSFLGSRDRARMTETAESEDRIRTMDDVERGPDLRLLIPKVSGDLRTAELDLENHEIAPMRTVQQMVEEALSRVPKDDNGGGPRLELSPSELLEIQEHHGKMTMVALKVPANDRVSQTKTAKPSEFPPPSPKPLGPTVRNEMSKGPTVPDETSMGPTVRDEMSTGPTVRDEMSTGPTVRDEMFTGPIVLDDTSTAPASQTSREPRSSVPARRESSSYRSSRRNSKAALESLLNLKVNTPTEKFQQRMSLVLGKDIRFARDSDLSEDEMLALQFARRVRFLMPSHVHTYQQVQLEGEELANSDAQTDVELIAAVDRNIDHIKDVSARLELAIREYDPESYRSPNLDKMMERKKSVAPEWLTRKFQSFQQRKLIGTTLIFPSVEGKRSKRPGKNRLMGIRSDESLVPLDSVLADTTDVSKKTLMGGERKRDSVKMDMIRRIREKGKQHNINGLGKIVDHTRRHHGLVISTHVTKNFRPTELKANFHRRAAK